MTDKKISALPSASTPLVGTEVLPIVQSGTTDKVSVANLTAGRDVSTAAISSTAGFFTGTTHTYVHLKKVASYENLLMFDPVTLNGTTPSWSLGQYTGTGTGAFQLINYNGSSVTEVFTGSPNGDLKINVGNLIQGTAAKGINFTANTPAAGMTSQLLNWYEEGTWTPSQGVGLTVVGSFSSSGKYTRIGRQVTIQGRVAGSTSIACSAFGVVCPNLPFSSGTTAFSGSLYGGSTATGGTTATANGVLYSVQAVTAGSEIVFTIVLFV